ncbi:hypothetical protein [Puniceicoccus vermicola]|uniref:Uncharacterized protein n=1 Tax=Puniceicoccus vermicola TaxID=388746 RepID=A0A7X1AXG7_9BACT|nr:hypothetical protein [Puniceicoccus vermicola]MBC2601825.1 hypothetical protein [Puniceicoccus vermicola]
MKYLKNPAPIGLALMLFFNSLAQAATMKEEDLVSVEFTTLALGNRNIEDLKYESDGQVRTISIYTRTFTQPHSYSGPPSMIFFREERSPSDGTIQRIPVANAKLSPNQKEVLILFMGNDGGSDEHYQVFTVKRDRSIFPAGSYQIFNLSEYAITGKIGEELFQLNDMDSTVVELSNRETTAIEVKFARSEGDSWTLAYNSLWPHRTNFRSNIFIFGTDDEVNPVNVQVFKEYLNPDSSE